MLNHHGRSHKRAENEATSWALCVTPKNRPLFTYLLTLDFRTKCRNKIQEQKRTNCDTDVRHSWSGTSYQSTIRFQDHHIPHGFLILWSLTHWKHKLTLLSWTRKVVNNWPTDIKSSDGPDVHNEPTVSLRDKVGLCNWIKNQLNKLTFFPTGLC